MLVCEHTVEPLLALTISSENISFHRNESGIYLSYTMDDQNTIAPEGVVTEDTDQMVAAPTEAAPEGEAAAA